MLPRTRVWRILVRADWRSAVALSTTHDARHRAATRPMEDPSTPFFGLAGSAAHLSAGNGVVLLLPSPRELPGMHRRWRLRNTAACFSSHFATRLRRHGARVGLKK